MDDIFFVRNYALKNVFQINRVKRSVEYDNAVDVTGSLYIKSKNRGRLDPKSDNFSYKYALDLNV
jgi:hypothetical protein